MKTKYWICVNTFLLLLTPLCIYLNLYHVLGSSGYIKAGLFFIGMGLFYINHLILPLNVILLIALCVKLIRDKQICAKQFVFASVNAICIIGYVLFYSFYLRDAMRMFVV